MRTLIYIPVFHNYVDMDIPAHIALDPKSERYKVELAINKLWDVIEAELLKLNLDPNGLQIYQDSWSENSDYRLIRILAVAGSRNFQIISRYLHGGAMLMKTEKEEMGYHRFLPNPNSRFEPEAESYLRYLIRINLLDILILILLSVGFADLIFNVKERDKFIAKRIQDTLKDGATGILFIGSKHNVEKYITAEDIKIIRLPAVEEEVLKILKEFNF